MRAGEDFVHIWGVVFYPDLLGFLDWTISTDDLVDYSRREQRRGEWSRVEEDRQ